MGKIRINLVIVKEACMASASFSEDRVKNTRLVGIGVGSLVIENIEIAKEAYGAESRYFNCTEESATTKCEGLTRVSAHTWIE